MIKEHRQRVRHRRAWYFLWFFCACGHRWRCPRSLPARHRPIPPTAALPAARQPGPPPLPTARPVVVPDPPPPPARVRSLNRRPEWDTARHRGEQADKLAHAQVKRLRRAERV